MSALPLLPDPPVRRFHADPAGGHCNCSAIPRQSTFPHHLRFPRSLPCVGPRASQRDVVATHIQQLPDRSDRTIIAATDHSGNCQASIALGKPSFQTQGVRPNRPAPFHLGHPPIIRNR